MTAKAQGNNRERRRILIVEDDDSTARMLLKVLGTRYAVGRASDGMHAVALASQSPPDLVMLDVMMPGLDGFATATQLRALPGLRAVPIIFLTAKAQPGDVIRGIQAGARHYLTKPFKVDDLLAKVKKTIGE